MPVRIDQQLVAPKLVSRIERLFELSAAKILSIEKSWEQKNGSPVCTVKGKYGSRAWTEWTQGFQFGSALLQFDATGEQRFLEIGRRNTIDRMSPHLSHTGVHDHGFNNISTYGNLWRLMREGKLCGNEQENNFYELALKISGAVQAARWTKTGEGQGYIYSFNGPHSLFIDTMRSLRSLALAHRLGQVLVGEQDARISLLERLLIHGHTTARFSIYYGDNRDAYDVHGRTAHESIFNTNNGTYRCPNSQQGYSPFSTWMRGLAWAILCFAEQLEYLGVLRASRPRSSSPRNLSQTQATFLRAAMATADFYLKNACADGIPVWDTGAPNLHRLIDYQNKPADPWNGWEPIDSSAAAIAAQGLLRLGNYLANTNRKNSVAYRQAGLTIAATLFDEPYLSIDSKHQGLLLHSVYHRPKGWDYIPRGQTIPNGESSMWGDYHVRELALFILREARAERSLTFFAGG